MVNIMAPTPPQYEWYQIVAMVEVRAFAKALQDDDLKVHFIERIVCCSCVFFLLFVICFCKQFRVTMLPCWNK
jgi:hypothetical protein